MNKSVLTSLAAILVLARPTDAFAQGAYERLTIIAPAAPGGGWDQTARVMQHALEAEQLARTAIVENVPGAAGTIGLSQFVGSHQGDDRTLLITGLVMVGAIIFNDSPVSLVQTTPLARLTGEFEVIAVPASSPIVTMRDIVDRLRAHPGAVAWGGGSAGGTDHILAGLIAEAAGVDARRVNYIAFSGGGEAVAALLGSQVTAGISGYSEFAAHIASGRLRALAISSPARVAGIDVPTLTESDLDVSLANWRGVVAPPGISAAARLALTQTLERMTRGTAWQQSLRERGWTDLYLAGDEFSRFLDEERVRVTRIARRLRSGVTTGTPHPGARIFPLAVLFGALIVGVGLLRARLRLRESERRRVGAFGTKNHRSRGAREEPNPRAVLSCSTLPSSLAPVVLDRKRVNSRALALVAVGLLVHLALLEIAGFVIASTLLFWIVSMGLGSVCRARDLMIAVVFSTAVYLAFTVGLGLSLPCGFLWPSSVAPASPPVEH